MILTVKKSSIIIKKEARILETINNRRISNKKL